MPDHVVEQLDLNLLGVGLSSEDLRAAERFTQAVLERACEGVEPRLNGRILAVRALPFRLVLPVGGFLEPGAIASAAEDLAAALSRLEVAEGRRIRPPGADAKSAVFVS